MPSLAQTLVFVSFSILWCFLANETAGIPIQFILRRILKSTEVVDIFRGALQLVQWLLVLLDLLVQLARRTLGMLQVSFSGGCPRILHVGRTILLKWSPVFLSVVLASIIITLFSGPNFLGLEVLFLLRWLLFLSIVDISWNTRFASIHLRNQKCSISVAFVTLPLSLSIFLPIFIVGRSTLIRASLTSFALGPFVLQVRHDAVLFQVIDIQGFQEFLQILITFFKFLKELLSVRSGLGRGPRLHVLLDLAPLFSVELESNQEAKVLILGPATHALLELDAAPLQLLALVDLTLVFGAPDDGASSYLIFVEGEVLGKVGCATRNIPKFASGQLGWILMEGQTC